MSAYDFRGSLPLITYGAADVSNPATWTLSADPPAPAEHDQQLPDGFGRPRVDGFKRKLVTLKFGPQWKNYVFKSTERRRSNGTTANQENIIPAAVAGAQIATCSRIVKFGGGLVCPRRHRVVADPRSECRRR